MSKTHRLRSMLFQQGQQFPLALDIRQQLQSFSINQDSLNLTSVIRQSHSSQDRRLFLSNRLTVLTFMPLAMPADRINLRPAILACRVDGIAQNPRDPHGIQLHLDDFLLCLQRKTRKRKQKKNHDAQL